MKFYGIDMQGELKLQELSVLPTPYSTNYDRRFVHFIGTTSKDRLYLGGTNSDKWVEILTQDSDATNFRPIFDPVYHVKGGASNLDFIAEDLTVKTITGDGGYANFTDQFIKLNSDSSPLNGDAGIIVETNLAVDPSLIWDNEWYNNIGNRFSGTPTSLGWWVVRGNAENSSTHEGGVATESWVDWRIAQLGVSGYIDATELATALNDYYTKTVADGKFVQFTAEGSGETTCFASISADLTWTVVRRNGSGDIWANVGNLTATRALYADLAEKYTCMELPVGTVVEVSDDEEYEVVPCAFELSPTAVGVISENPAYLMNSSSEGQPVALTGKVPVRVVGEVFKGDFIVPAGAGCARKGEPHELVFKIGVSLETSLQDGERLVNCIIK